MGTVINLTSNISKIIRCYILYILQHNIGPVQFLIRLSVDLSKLPDSVRLVGNDQVCLLHVLKIDHVDLYSHRRYISHVV